MSKLLPWVIVVALAVGTFLSFANAKKVERGQKGTTSAVCRAVVAVSTIVRANTLAASQTDPAAGARARYATNLRRLDATVPNHC